MASATRPTASGRPIESIQSPTPRIDWAREGPTLEALAELHHRAHEACYIANSIRGTVRVEG